MPDYYVPVCLQKESTSLSNGSAPPDGVSFGSSGIVRMLLFFWDCSPSPSSFSSFGYSLTAPLALSHGIWPRVWMPWSPHNSFRKRILKMRLPSSLLLKPRFKNPRSLHPVSIFVMVLLVFFSDLCFLHCCRRVWSHMPRFFHTTLIFIYVFCLCPRPPHSF